MRGGGSSTDTAGGVVMTAAGAVEILGGAKIQPRIVTGELPGGAAKIFSEILTYTCSCVWQWQQLHKALQVVQW